MSANSENLHELGKAWGPSKAQVMDALLRNAGAHGAKRSISRVAKDADVSPEFVRSLKGFDARVNYGRTVYGNHERAAVLRVLRVLGTTESAFLAQARYYASGERS